MAISVALFVRSFALLFFAVLILDFEAGHGFGSTPASSARKNSQTWLPSSSGSSAIPPFNLNNRLGVPNFLPNLNWLL